MINEIEILKIVVKRLTSARIPYMVTGSIAANFSKLFWARESLSEVQLRDVKNLLRTSPNLDRGYIEEWVRELKLDEVYNEVKR